MEPVKIEFVNYKKLKNQEFQFGDSTIYMVVGSNDVGKTTFLEGLITMLQVRSEVKVPVTHGEKDGEIRFHVKDDKGNPYIASFKFTNESGKFVLTSADGLTASQVTKIRDFFGHHSLSAEDFIRLGANEKDRKKQRDIFLNLLSPESLANFRALEEKLEGKMVLRKEANAEVLTLEKTIAGSISAEEMLALEKKGELEKEKESFALKAAKILELNNKVAVLRERERSLDTVNRTDELSEEKDSRISEIDIEIKATEAKLLTLKERRTSTLAAYNEKIEKENERLNIALQEKEKIEKEIKSFPVIEINEARKAEVETLLNSMTAIASRAEMVKTLSATLDEKKHKANSYNDDVLDLRTQIQEVVAEAQKVMPNISIHSDGLYYKMGDKEVPFMENQVGTAEIYKVTIQILLALNKKTPIIIVGRAESIDNNNMDEIANMIEAWRKETGINAKLIVDRVLPNTSDVKLVAYEEFDETLKENLK